MKNLKIKQGIVREIYKRKREITIYHKAVRTPIGAYSGTLYNYDDTITINDFNVGDEVEIELTYNEDKSMIIQNMDKIHKVELALTDDILNYYLSNKVSIKEVLRNYALRSRKG